MRRDDQRQAVKNIPLEQLKPFKNHPFQVRDDEEFRRLVESIEIHGVIHPAVARQIGEDCYELISGHRRKAACEVLGYSEMPVLVRSMTDDEAVVNMVDANLQRETILPSERAFAYKMKLEIFADYLAADETIEVYISCHGCVRVEFDQDFHYCTGEVCHTPKELFDLLADDYRTYVEIELTKGKRELTEDDVKEADALCKRYLDRWKEELE